MNLTTNLNSSALGDDARTIIAQVKKYKKPEMMDDLSLHSKPPTKRNRIMTLKR